MNSVFMYALLVELCDGLAELWDLESNPVQCILLLRLKGRQYIFYLLFMIPILLSYTSFTLSTSEVN